MPSVKDAMKLNELCWAKNVKKKIINFVHEKHPFVIFKWDKIDRKVTYLEVATFSLDYLDVSILGSTCKFKCANNIARKI